ncbi:hypothetical protein R1flu_028830 [Riccia fluitans]|uniref:Uncharacterized protein n=1 Tax=Riccia fluitans TaxID=41844 RepID=A0ABD1XMX2_9MARC
MISTHGKYVSDDRIPIGMAKWWEYKNLSAEFFRQVHGGIKLLSHEMMALWAPSLTELPANDTTPESHGEDRDVDNVAMIAKSLEKMFTAEAGATISMDIIDRVEDSEGRKEIIEDSDIASRSRRQCKVPLRFQA